MERQCDAVRRFHRQYAGNAELVISALARGFASRAISRVSNTHNWSDEMYARALYRNYFG
jgi:hypothetical protein